MFKLATTIAISSVLLLSGCSPTEIHLPMETAAPSAAPEVPVAEAPVDEAPATPASVAHAPVNARGNTGLAFGSSFTDGGATMTILGATFDVPCTSKIAGAANNGHYLMLDVAATTASDATASPFGVFAWTWIDNNGQTMGGNIASLGTYMCLGSASSMPHLGPGQSGSGKIVLDVNSVGGTLVYRAPFADSGHEWNITVAK